MFLLVLVTFSELPLFNEFIERHNIFVHPSLSIKSLETGHRGVFTDSSLPEGTLLLDVPADAFLFAPVQIEGFSHYDADALHLLKEREKGAASRHFGYIAQLPAHVDLPLFWDEETLQKADPSHLRQLVEQQRAASRVNHADIGGSFSLDDYRWALSVLWSRVFFVGRPALVPVADSFNCCGEDGMIRVEHTEADGSLKYYAGRRIEAEEELLVRYGKSPKATVELLLNYGFTRGHQLVAADYAVVGEHRVMHGRFPFDLLREHRRQAGASEEEIATGKPLQDSQMEYRALLGMHESLSARLAEYEEQTDVGDMRIRDLHHVERECIAAALQAVDKIVKHAFSKKEL